MTDLNKQWIASGKIGCTFAALFAKNPSKVNWVTLVNPDTFYIPNGACILSLQFPNMNKKAVYDWAIANGFYTEKVDEKGCLGLRRDIDNNVSWVQYFGPDSHVATRQAPIPELIMAVKLPPVYYAKVGFKGILHLAHASVASLSKRASDLLWDASFKNTAKRLGHTPTIFEAAKTTYNEQP